MKKCICCKKEKDFDRFRKDIRSTDGYQKTCFDCLEYRKRVNREAREKLLEINRSPLITRFLSAKNFADVV